MDAIYARQRHFYDLTRKYYLLGRDRLIARLDVPSGGTVLEVGCGTGRNLIAVAKRYPAAKLYGLDISEEMLTTARASVTRAGLSDRIVLQQADATDFDAAALFGAATFDRVLFSYTLSMIPDWQAALRQGASVTGGALHLIDFGQFERLPGWFGRGMKAWLTKFDVEPRAGLFDFLKSLDPTFACRPLFRGYAWSGELRR
ncbi:class I SAM-dependent methyltransferase [Sphingomonas sp. SUN039]|uniref:class I SAM-dependent methyltransferase n=1 Tax=Sphingomonas sp. SUN039 TaxID=2937787 RepID=UPI0021642721|nr:methyltransferase domain-containing protein [Sphingomonas sp. SUN039]UVO55813.1 methyltransferase domain-containing protein [Sphingomonas sp. SUN039]